jgi:hypothetical protein
MKLLPKAVTDLSLLNPFRISSVFLVNNMGELHFFDLTFISICTMHKYDHPCPEDNHHGEECRD